MNVLKTVKIIFPGIKYGLNRPLLKSLNEAINGNLIYLDYSFLYDEKSDSFDKNKAYDYVLSQINLEKLREFNEIIFISKSIGTIFAGKLRNEIEKKEPLLGSRIKYICLTPLDESIQYLHQTDYIAYGTNDKYLSSEARDKLKYRFINLNIVNNGNHRLEVNSDSNSEENLKIVKNIVLEALTYLDSSNYME